MTARLDDDVMKKLKLLKERLGLRSTNDVVERLLKHYDDEVSPLVQEEEDGGLEAMEEEEEENERVPQLFSYETLAQEEKAIKYFTGLKQSCMDWVRKVMADAVRRFACFCDFRVWPCR